MVLLYDGHVMMFFRYMHVRSMGRQDEDSWV